MQTFQTMHDKCNRAGHPCAYWGEHGEWFVVLGQHRDSNSLDRSNFRSMLKKLGGECDTVKIERENHWAVGWVEFILVAPEDQKRLATVQEIKDALDDYPVVDENDWSELEYNDFWEWAERELGQFEGWADVLSDQIDLHSMEYSEDSPGQWETMEAARAILEERQPLYDNHASCPIDPRQMRLFN